MPEPVEPFVAVYAEHLPAVSRYLARRVDRDDVDDLAADVFAIAWRKRAQVAPGEELPWLYSIAAYQVANHRRRLAARASVLGLLAVPDSAPSAESLVTADAELARAWAAISPRDREVLALVVIDDLAVAQAAVAIGASLATALVGDGLRQRYGDQARGEAAVEAQAYGPFKSHARA